MKILFDQGTPAPLRKALALHAVDTAFERGWSQLKNGDLIQHAETGGYDLLVTTDQNLRYQQNLVGRRIAIFVLPTTSWPRLHACERAIAEAVNAMQPGGYIEFTL